jgi:hypothetical protein
MERIMKCCFTDGSDIVIANNPQEAEAVWQMEIGDLRMPGEDAPFKLISGGELIKLVFPPWGYAGMPDITNIQIPDNAMIEPADGEFLVTATAYAWADANRKCILSQT